MSDGFTTKLRQYGTFDHSLAADEIDKLNATIKGAKLCSRGWSAEYGWNPELKQYGFYARQKWTDWCEWAGMDIEDAWRMISEKAREA